MDACLRPRLKTAYHCRRNQDYETTYKRTFSAKRPARIVEGAPLSQRYLIGCPFNLADPVGESIYMVDFTGKKSREPNLSFHQSTNMLEPCDSQFLQRSESSNNATSNEIKQALRNQLDSTYQVDYTGSPQGFKLPLAYTRSRPFWRNQVPHTLDSEYRNHFQNHPHVSMHFGGRFAYTNRMPADAIVPQTLPTWKKKPLHSIYTCEIGQKAPSDRYMKEFVDSFGAPTN
ncbi:unnamed protein product [Adineta ricciae]|uniref:Uncharacterized protein n=1 Tax=Adineta ricciae TaxID=249248 RepID=A0A815ICM9_ADIRI|nr:unnamed protein product [Adineta ricciae]